MKGDLSTDAWTWMVLLRCCPALVPLCAASCLLSYNCNPSNPSTSLQRPEESPLVLQLACLQTALAVWHNTVTHPYTHCQVSQNWASSGYGSLVTCWYWLSFIQHMCFKMILKYDKPGVIQLHLFCQNAIWCFKHLSHKNVFFNPDFYHTKKHVKNRSSGNLL